MRKAAKLQERIEKVVAKLFQAEERGESTYLLTTMINVAEAKLQSALDKMQ